MVSQTMTIRQPTGQAFRAGIPMRAIRNTEDIPVIFQPRGAQSGVLRFPMGTRVGRSERVAFIHRGHHSGVIQLLLDVTRVDSGSGGVQASVEVRAAFTRESAATLREVLEGHMGWATLRPSDIVAKNGGFYVQGIVSQRPAAPEPVDERRAAPRVPVRVNLTWVVGGRRCQGRAYNVSEGGLYLMTMGGAEPPKVGDRIGVSYPVPRLASDVLIDIVGRVCWVGDGSSSAGVGVGIEIESFREPADGRIWVEYCQQELEFGKGRVKVVPTSRR